MNSKIISSAAKIERRKKIVRNVKLALLFVILLLVVLYIVMGILFHRGSFTITLDRNLYFERGIIIYDDPNYKVFRTELRVPTLEYFDNISGSWLPTDLADHEGGSHNGNNFLAYTFFIENVGDLITDYWSEIIIDDVTRNVDEAIRIKVYRNGDPITYAKIGGNGEPEPGTTPFKSDRLVARNHIMNFRPGDINKYTIVVWIEGNDPDTTDNILGGTIKLHKHFLSEVVEE